MTTYEKFTAAKTEYLSRLQHNNLSPCTLANYTRALDKFAAHLAEDDPETDIYTAVVSWRDSMTEAGLTPSTIRQYLTTLRIFFGRTAHRSFPEALRFSDNPIESDLSPKVPKQPVPTILTDDQLINLWTNRPATARQQETWPRNYAIVTLILTTGLRNAEVLDLTLADIDFRYAEITVRSGKGRKFRVVDAPELVLTALELYLESGIRPAGLPDSAPLFGTTAAHEYGGGRCSTKDAERWHRGTGTWLSQLIETHVRNQTGIDGVRSHDLRHLFARVELNTSGNISELQAALGHSSPVVTQIYSGRVLQRRCRDSAAQVLEARDAWAQRNREKLEEHAKEKALAV